MTELIMACLDQEQCFLNSNEIILFFYQNKNQQILKGTLHKLVLVTWVHLQVRKCSVKV